MLHISSNTITDIINCSLVKYQRQITPSNLDKGFLDGSLDISTGSNNEWDVNNKDLDYASASKPKAIIGSRKNCWQNKALIVIVYLFLLVYTCKSPTNCK